MIVSNINGIAMKAMSEKALNIEVKQLIRAIQYVFLEQRIPVFFSVSSEAPKQGRCVVNCYEYDPLELQLCIDLDNTIYKDRTFFITLDKDISGIDSLVIHYLARDHRP